MIRKVHCFVAGVAAVTMVGQLALAQGSLPLFFDEVHYPTNPHNSFGGFPHNAFTAAGAVTVGPDSIILDVGDGTTDVGGGIGVDYGLHDGVLLQPVNFDPSITNIVMRVKILENNAAQFIRVTYNDHDNISQSIGDEHVFRFDLSGVPMDGQFHDLISPLLGPAFLETGVQFNKGAGDGIQNPGLGQIQIQGEWGTMERLNVEIDYVSFFIPEPATVSLVALGALSLVGFGRRRRSR